MADRPYWNRRLRRYGHTGWSDAATYCYDQRLRLAAIEKMVLATQRSAARSALDFGCGVGDFCALLATRFERVIGYDVADAIVQRARARHSSPRVRYTGDLDEALRGPHDLILSVTVLQHIVDDEELARLLRRFAAALAPGGRVAVLETLADSERGTGYLKRRTFPGLLAAFAGAGLAPIAQHDFYHPSEAPTPAYRRYRGRPMVRALARLAAWRMPFATAALRGIARAAADADRDWLDAAPSPTKIVVFERREDTR